MIYELSQQVSATLRARQFPIPVLYGPEHLEREGADPAIIIDRDNKNADTVAPPRGPQANPKKYFERSLAAVARIYAKSRLAGARHSDHVRECEVYIDAFLVALAECTVTRTHGQIAIGTARYLAPEERKPFAGVVYEITFRVPRSVYALTYRGEARPEAAPADVRNTTRVRLAGGDPDSDPETGCGAP